MNNNQIGIIENHAIVAMEIPDTIKQLKVIKTSFNSCNYAFLNEEVSRGFFILKYIFEEEDY